MAGKRRRSPPNQVDKTPKRRNGSTVSGSRFRCPFRARESNQGSIQRDCKEDQTFSGIEKLNEHLSRVHSLKYWCLRCKTKFRITKDGDLKILRGIHDLSCREEPWPEDKAQWVQGVLMTEAQYRQWLDWKTVDVPHLATSDGKKEKKPDRSWRQIYKSLFPDTVNFPNPYCSTDSSHDFASGGDEQIVYGAGLPLGIEDNEAHYKCIYESLEDIDRSRGWRQPPELGAAFASTYSLDHPAKQQQQREEAQRVTPWADKTKGSASIEYSATSGTTDSLQLQQATSQSYFQGDSLTPATSAGSNYLQDYWAPGAAEFIREEGLHDENYILE